MILLLLVFITIMLGSSKDPYAFAFNRKRGKKLTKNSEYAEVIARYVNSKPNKEGN